MALAAWHCLGVVPFFASQGAGGMVADRGFLCGRIRPASPYTEVSFGRRLERKKCRAKSAGTAVVKVRPVFQQMPSEGLGGTGHRVWGRLAAMHSRRGDGAVMAGRVEQENECSVVLCERHVVHLRSGRAAWGWRRYRTVRWTSAWGGRLIAMCDGGGFEWGALSHCAMVVGLSGVALSHRAVGA